MKREIKEGAALPYLILAALPAILSFAWFRFVRALLGLAKARYAARHPETSRRWQVFSREFVEKPLVLPLILTTAPRWNPHAVIGTFGPVAVQRRIAIDATAARRSGEWFFVIYRHPGRETVGSFSHLTDCGGGWAEFEVPQPGQYAIGARFYHPDATVTLPAVQADGAAVGEAREVAADVNQFYHTLRTRESTFHRCLAYYIWVLLRSRAFLPTAWVHREFLPVGNPETTFEYGLFRRNETVEWELAPERCAGCDVYVTLYSRGSFPFAWFEWSPTQLSPERVAPCDGYFLIRIQPGRRLRPNETRAGGDTAAASNSVRTLHRNRVAETN